MSSFFPTFHPEPSVNHELYLHQINLSEKSSAPSSDISEHTDHPLKAIKPHHLSTALDLIHLKKKLDQLNRRSLLKFKKLKGYNLVYQISHKYFTNTPLAYYKEIVDQDQIKNCSYLEKMAWDIANLLEIEQFFTPTILTKIRIEHHHVHTEDPKEIPFGNTFNRFQGSLQVVIEGAELNKKQNNKYDVVNFYKACISAEVLRLYDLHASNVFVNNDGNFIFFDNSRCLPHSNELIKFQDQLLLPFNNILLSFDRSTTILRSDHKIELSLFCDKIYKNFYKLPLYFSSFLTRKKVSHLSVDMHNTILALDAMKIRLEQMKSKFSDPELTLKKLCLTETPLTRLSSALHLVSKIDTHFRKKSLTADLFQLITSTFGSNFLDIQLNECLRYQLSPKYIKKLCDSDLDLKSVFENILKIKEKIPHNQIKLEIIEILNDLNQYAVECQMA